MTSEILERANEIARSLKNMKEHPTAKYDPSLIDFESLPTCFYTMKDGLKEHTVQRDCDPDGQKMKENIPADILNSFMDDLQYAFSRLQARITTRVNELQREFDNLKT